MVETSDKWRRIMIGFDVNHYCYGCTACKHKCPTQAISMEYNEEGFLVPKIDKKKCVNCSLCEKVCPYLNRKSVEMQEDYECFAMYTTDEQKRMLSTSGGIFYILAEKFIEQKGYVCGCIWDEHMEATHIVTNKISDIQKMRGSKYVQSDLKDCFIKVEELLKENNKILFSGTPCQIAGVKNYIGENDNLYTCGLICEGVPSPMVLKRNVEELEKKYKKKVVNYNFREKCSDGWKNPYTACDFEDGSLLRRIPDLEDYYTIGFYQCLFLRNSCYQCQYKIDSKVADIIIGDFWGCAEKVIQESKNMGVSAVIVSSKKGKEMLDTIYENSIIYETDLEKIAKENFPLCQSVEKNENRDQFFRDLKRTTFSKAVFKNIKNNKIKFIIKQVLNKLHLLNLVWRR